MAVPMEPSLTEVAHVIQLAVAPVFVPTGVAGPLAVFTNRLARIVDRSRVVGASMAVADGGARPSSERELEMLGRRSRAVHLAIALVTLCALLVCAVIAALFFGVFFALNVSTGVGWIFIAAMLALIGGLIVFLREIHLATSSVRFGSKPRSGQVLVVTRMVRLHRALGKRTI